MLQPVVPSFFLYGEPPREVGDHFLHLESLDERSRPNNWNIRPHAHTNLNHIFCISHGAGQLNAERLETSFEAPCVMLIPAGVVHAFRFDDETTGSVLTLSETYLRELLQRESEFASLFDLPALCPMSEASSEIQLLVASIERLRLELSWHAPAHRSAIDGLLLGILVTVLRVDRRERVAGSRDTGRDAELVARFRRLLEQQFHSNRSIDDYAGELKVSASRFRLACSRVTRRSPLQLIQGRILLEARRLLLYSNMTISEVAYFLGFDDPAYFTRFFSRHVGVSPRSFRQRRGEGAT